MKPLMRYLLVFVILISAGCAEKDEPSDELSVIGIWKVVKFVGGRTEADIWEFTDTEIFITTANGQSFKGTYIREYYNDPTDATHARALNKKLQSLLQRDRHTIPINWVLFENVCKHSLIKVEKQTWDL